MNLEELETLIKKLPDLAPSADLERRFLEKARSREAVRGNEPSPSRRRGLLAVAASLLVCAGVLWVVVAPPGKGGRIAGQEVRPIIEKLRSDDPRVREEASRRLKELGQAAVPELEKAAKDSDPEVAGRARHLLRVIALQGRLTPNLRKVLPGVEDRLASDPELGWAKAFLEACRESGLSAADLEALADPAVRTARTKNEKDAILTGIWGYQLRSALPAILPLLEDEDPEASGKARLVLAVADARELVPELLKRLKDKGVGAPPEVIGLLGDLDVQDARPEILKLLKGPGPSLRAEAVKALGALKAQEAIPAIVELLKDEDEFVRSAGAQALGDLGAANAVPALTALLDDPDDQVRWTALESLVVLRARDAAVPQLLKVLNDGAREPKVRSAAARALGELGVKEAAPQLVKALNMAPIEVQEGAAEALCVLGLREGVPRVLDSEHLGVLNALRAPDLWRILQRKAPSGRHRGSANALLRRIAAEANVTAKNLPEKGEAEAWVLRWDVGWGPRASLWKRIQAVLESHIEILRNHYEVILEKDHLRFLPREEARAFWRNWWATQPK